MSLTQALERSDTALHRALDGFRATPCIRELGRVLRIDGSVIRVDGLPGVRSEELVEFPEGLTGLVLDLDPEGIGVALLGAGPRLVVGDPVRRGGRVADVPVGEQLLGRVVDGTGRPLDEQGVPDCEQRWPVERDAPPIMARGPVNQPLDTGIKVIDALIPIGRGQRELILGDRQTGKTAIALDTIVNQRDRGMICVYCAIGQRASAVARVIDQLRDRRALDYSVVVVARGEDPPGLQYLTPFAATSIAEYFMEQGRDVLIVYDDLTRHARAYRELALLLRRPPGREAFPGDIFYVHAHLLERATRLRSGGSLTALPILETEAQNLSAYIPTNLVSITDGQLYLSPELFHKGLLPAVDVGRSVSRVGGKAQLPAYRAVAGDLKLSYAQFEELEVFARFGTRLDEDTRRTIEHGRRVREMLRQPAFSGIPPAEQVAILLATSRGLLDELAEARLGEAERLIRSAVRESAGELCARIEDGERLSESDQTQLLTILRKALERLGIDGDA